ncbi:MAG: PTS sugar transporter subunit IIA [Tractidigestivibacter sp.]|jgi:PTS system fructose-specific IIA component|uniref:PTS sugar transporter subunit IIA n=1 Tax=Tractidigestivibacter sp. TaxID=2847320 RepID=UPI003D8AB2CB
MDTFITKDNVLLHQRASSRDEALHTISELAVKLGVAKDVDSVYQGFLAREGIDQTGMGDGFAIPHCKTAAIEKASLVVFKNETPLQWPSLDGKPVDIAMALLVPEAEAGTTHLRLLAKAATLLMDDGFKKLLREGDDASAIADAINQALSE